MRAVQRMSLALEGKFEGLKIIVISKFPYSIQIFIRYILIYSSLNLVFLQGFPPQISEKLKQTGIVQAS